MAGYDTFRSTELSQQNSMMLPKLLDKASKCLPILQRKLRSHLHIIYHWETALGIMILMEQVLNVPPGQVQRATP